MGAMFACATVALIAIGGFIYFKFFDKKEKGHLADMGIECILQGSNFNNTYGPTPATEIVVLVDEVDLAKAQEALPQERPAREDEPEDATVVKPKAKMSL